MRLSSKTSCNIDISKIYICMCRFCLRHLDSKYYSLHLYVLRCIFTMFQEYGTRLSTDLSYFAQNVTD